MTKIFNYDLPKDQHLIEMRFGFEKGADYLGPFHSKSFMPANVPRAELTEPFNTYPRPSIAVSGNLIPVLHARRSSLRYGVAAWGLRMRDKTIENYVHYREASVGYPALIPASFVDMILKPKNSGALRSVLRLRNPNGLVFVGARYTPDPLEFATSVAPFVQYPSEQMSKYSDWEPLVIPLAPEPTLRGENWDFVCRRPLPCRICYHGTDSLLREVISLEAALKTEAVN